jgi:uncharacterized membrane protein
METPRRCDAVVTPEWAVGVLGLAAGLAFLVMTPPFQAPDEPAHFARAYAVSEGQWLPRWQDGRPGADLPAGYGDLRDAVADLPAHPERRLAPRLNDLLAIPGRDDRRTFTVIAAGAAVYTPVPYLPMAAGIRVARRLHLGPAGTLYAGRLAGLVTSLGLMILSIRICPVRKWPLALLALTPMAAFLRSSVTADSQTSAAAAVLTSVILGLIVVPRAAQPRHVALLLLASATLALSKSVYAPLSALVLAIPRANLGRRRRGIVIGAVLLVTAAGVGVSTWVAHLTYTPFQDGADPAAQLARVLGDPGRFLAVTASDLWRHLPRYAVEFVGKLGWLDTTIPAPLTVGYGLLLAALTVQGEPLATSMDEGRRMIFVVIVTLCVFLVALSQYLSWTAVGAGILEGVQGRYFIPLGPPVAALFLRRGPGHPSDAKLSWTLSACAAVILIAALMAEYARYYAA